MSELERELFEQRLISIAKGLDYPRTPDIAAAVMTRLRPSPRPRFISRKFVLSLTIILVLVSSLLSIPTARAAILEFIQIGIVRIFPRNIEPTVEPIHTSTPASEITRTPTPSLLSDMLIPALREVVGRTTLAEGQQRTNYPILLPQYPSDLAEPDYVFVQDAEGEMTILIWLDPQQPDKVLMSLHFIPSGSWVVRKMEPTIIQETQVNRQRAIWTTGPYPLIVSNDLVEYVRLVEGNVLIWTEGNITYRLETGLPLLEAIKVAESLNPIP